MTSPVLILLILSAVCFGLFVWDLIKGRQEKQNLVKKSNSLREGIAMTNADLHQHYIALGMQRMGLGFRTGGLFAAYGILLALWAFAYASVGTQSMHRAYLTASNVALFLAFLAFENIRNRKNSRFLAHARTLNGAICPCCTYEFAEGLKLTSCPKCGLPIRPDVLRKSWMGEEQ